MPVISSRSRAFVGLTCYRGAEAAMRKIACLFDESARVRSRSGPGHITCPNPLLQIESAHLSAPYPPDPDRTSYRHPLDTTAVNSHYITQIDFNIIISSLFPTKLPSITTFSYTPPTTNTLKKQLLIALTLGILHL